MSIGALALSLFRTGVTATFDSMGSTFPKAAVAAVEDGTQSKVHLARQCLVDEGPEVFWKTVVGSVFVKVMKAIAPAIPEQIANFPGEMLGAYLHWHSASHQCKNGEAQRAVSGEKKPGILQNLFSTRIKPLINDALKFVGLPEKDADVSFMRFAIIQSVLFTGGALALKGAEEENIPGMNMNHEDSKLTTFFKIAGYTLFEQCTHMFSQTMRYYIDYKKEFLGEDRKNRNIGALNKDILAKALANTFHERGFPGNIPSAITGCLSTLWLGKYIPKSIAGALGEAPAKGLERILTLHLRRSTKDRLNEKGERVPNYRKDSYGILDGALKVSDFLFNGIRNFIVRKIVAPMFKPEEVDIKDYIKELENSYNMSDERLRKRDFGKPPVSEIEKSESPIQHLPLKPGGQTATA